MFFLATVFICFGSVESEFVDSTLKRVNPAKHPNLQGTAGAELIAQNLNLREDTPLTVVNQKWNALQGAAHAALPLAAVSWEEVETDVLVVVSVRDDVEVAMVLDRNIKILTAIPRDKFRFVIFNYDGTDVAFQKMPWYNNKDIVIYHEQTTGCKIELWSKIPTETTNKFHYLWFLDENIDLTFTSWSIIRRLIIATQGLVFHPAILPTDNVGSAFDEMNFANLADGSVGVAREESRSDMMAPILDTRLWGAVLERLSGNSGNICYTDTFWDVIAFLGKLHGCGRAGPLVINSAPVARVDIPNRPQCNARACEEGNWRPISDQESASMLVACPGIPVDWQARYECEGQSLITCSGNLKKLAVGSLKYEVDQSIENLTGWTEGTKVNLRLVK
jgi:hypothetical protein